MRAYACMPACARRWVLGAGKLIDIHQEACFVNVISIVFSIPAIALMISFINIILVIRIVVRIIIILLVVILTIFKLLFLLLLLVSLLSLLLLLLLLLLLILIYKDVKMRDPCNCARVWRRRSCAGICGRSPRKGGTMHVGFVP